MFWIKHDTLRDTSFDEWKKLSSVDKWAACFTI